MKKLFAIVAIAATLTACNDTARTDADATTGDTAPATITPADTTSTVPDTTTINPADTSASH